MTLVLDRLASCQHEDWRTVLCTRANVLVIGRHDVLAAFVAICSDELRQPIMCASAAGSLPLFATGTLVIADVDQLDASGQRSLVAWIGARQNEDTQIISLTTIPLFSLVEAKEFDRDLYYRLNTICLDLQSLW